MVLNFDNWIPYWLKRTTSVLKAKKNLETVFFFCTLLNVKTNEKIFVSKDKEKKQWKLIKINKRLKNYGSEDGKLQGYPQRITFIYDLNLLEYWMVKFGFLS